MIKKLFLSFALLLIFFSPMLFERVILDGDLADEYMPKLFLIGESIRSLSFPLHEAGMGLGFPIYKDIQSGIFYPVNWIFALPFDFLFMVQLAIFLNSLIYAAGLILLLRLLYPENKYSSALLTAMLFSGFFVSHIPHYTLLCSIAVAPLFLFFYISFLKDRTKKRFISSVFCGILLMAAGHPQVFYLVFLLSLFLAFNKKSDRNSLVTPLMIFIFVFFTSLFITAPTMNLSQYSFRADDSMVYNIIPFKYLILLIFPNLFGGSALVGEQVYSGILNINEVQFYSSLLLLFAFSYMLKRIFLDKDLKYGRKLIVPVFFLLLSFFTEFNLHIFLTPGRSVGISVLTFLVLFLPDALEKQDRKTLILFSALFLIAFASASAKGYFGTDLLAPLILFVSYLALFMYKEKNKRVAELLLPLLIFADLTFSLGGIVDYSKRENVKNEVYPELSGKYVVTYLPDEVVFYSDYLKEHFKSENLEELKKYSSCGNRGVYYGAYSFNLYQNFTFAEYVDFFSDRSIMTGGFSNINFIMNPLIYDYDYLFVPDMPAFFNVTETLMIPYREGVADTFHAYFTGEIENISAEEAPENDYLRKVNSLKTGRLVLDGPTMIKGNGKILMLKKYQAETTVRFPELFENMNFEIVKKNPFYLFKRNRENPAPLAFMASPVNGSLIEGREADYVPMDILGGLFISIIAMITMFSYAKKEFK
ncbi:MAG: hypothetical protein AB7T10_08705 [bacterium]